MSPIKYIIVGGASVAVTKFYFGRSWFTALVVGLSVISVSAILISAKPSQ